ncbi:ubiquitin-conjugating enzyme [Microdochium bolleyi]|uniref:E2 ubiquitin-conjugating enzyme n=1 Tax=Microdochium bolleyi TaxID=196109 RepID=A0A136J3Z5_9PEZI|nr:ubiquitin-conjugating enzyme [Microdochium bolleyi]
MASTKRITKELAECTESPPDGITVSCPNEGDIHNWTAVLAGPQGSAYQGGTFTLKIKLPADYPFKAPQVSFATRIYHPNVTNDQTGAICLSVLKSENWKPASRIKGVLEAVRQLLVEPNPDDPLEARIADEYRQQHDEFVKNAKTYVERYASGKASPA